MLRVFPRTIEELLVFGFKMNCEMKFKSDNRKHPESPKGTHLNLQEPEVHLRRGEMLNLRL